MTPEESKPNSLGSNLRDPRFKYRLASASWRDASYGYGAFQHSPTKVDGADIPREHVEGAFRWVANPVSV